jgi:excisionase family DNA binding protein
MIEKKKKLIRGDKMKNLNVIEQLQTLLQRAQENALEDEKPLTFTQALEFLQVSRSTLYKLVHRKEIEYFKPSGGKLYFDKKVLLEYMRRGRVKSSEEIDDEAANYLTIK